jgi:hypothetical protein
MSMQKATIYVLVGVMAASVARADTCSKDMHPIDYKGKTVSVEDYRCKSSSVSAADDIRVTLYNVGEPVAGNLVMDTRHPDIDRIFGRLRIIENDVYREDRDFFARFGTSKTYSSSEHEIGADRWNITLNKPPSDDQDAEDNRDAETKSKPGLSEKMWYLSAPYQDMMSDRVFVRSASQTILQTDRWPNDYNMTYVCDGNISCTTLWKYIKVSDLDLILHDVKELIQRAEAILKRVSPRTVSTQSIIPEFEKSFAMFRYLSMGKWPDDFLTISTGPGSEECFGGDYWAFTFGARSLNLDMAVVSNTSNHPIRIDAIIGADSQTKEFRSVDSGGGLPAGPPKTLDFAPMDLLPGDEVAIPLRIGFDARDRRRTSDVDPKTVFEEIQSKRPRYVFSEVIGGFNHGKGIKKIRESFKAPKEISDTEYTYGPEIDLKGVRVGDRELILDNVLRVQDSDRWNQADLNLLPSMVRIQQSLRPFVCCPILYSWDELAQEWVYERKVIHSAHAPELAVTDRIQFSSLRTRFLIAEEELEASFIRQLRLILTLQDGEQIALAPNKPAPERITAYTQAEVVFDLPTTISRKYVVRTELEVAGYYRRYGDIVLGAKVGSSSRAKLKPSNLE